MVQEWVNTRNATAVSHVRNISVHGGAWNSDSSSSPHIVNQTQTNNRGGSPPRPHNTVKAVFISVACVPLSATFSFPST